MRGARGQARRDSGECLANRMLHARFSDESPHRARSERHVRRLYFAADAKSPAGIIVHADDLIAESELREERTCAADGYCVRQEGRGRAKRAHSRRLRNADAPTRIVSKRVQAPVCRASDRRGAHIRQLR